jgi:hypothetical protein
MLFKLLGLLIEYANRIAGTTDTMIGENPGQNTPASTFQGLQERGSKIYVWIFKRIWRAMKQEFKVRYKINARALPTAKHYGQSNALIQREDYRGDPDQIAPVVDPNLPSSVMRVQQAMFVAQRAMSAAGYDHEQVERMVLRSARVPNIDQIYPGPKDPRASAPPNPKAAIEELRLKGKEMDIAHKEKEWANKLMEERRLNTARIMQLEAQAYNLLTQAKTSKSELQLKAVELALGALQQYSEQLTNRIGALSSGEGNQQQPSGSAGSGGMGDMAAASDDSGVPGNAQSGAGPADGGLGGGSDSGPAT